VQLGTILRDRFELHREVGSGALGTVYEAHDRELACNVALKTLHTPGSRTFEFLKTEFRIARQLEHPNIARLHELFLAGDHCFFTMELVRGLPFDRALRDRVRAGSRDDVISICEQLVHGLDALHEAGFVHRDIKPANVLVESSSRLVLLDFDLAFRGDQTRIEAYGTPEYMAPEALFGRSSTSTDWYSVGMVLCEALSGRLPRSGQPPQPADLHHALRELPGTFSEAICGLLDPNPSRRLSGGDLLRSLGRTAPRRRVAPFVGRVNELDLLASVLETAQAGKAGRICISGPAGIGKTALLERFLDATGPAFVVRAACSHAEQIPLATVDNLVAGLGPIHDADSILVAPEDHAAVNRVFPSLFPATDEEEPQNPAGIPAETRGRALRGVARLLSSIAGDRVLVIALDDAQWADEWSLEIISDWLEVLAGRPHCLVATWRTPGEGANPIPEALFGVGAVLALAPLSGTQATALAEQLGASDVEAAVTAAAGNPLVLLHVCNAPGAEGTLDLSRLAPAQRRLAEVLSLALAPLPRGVACRAADLGDQAVNVLRELEGAKLMRLAGDGSGLTPFHDLVRQSALAGLADDSRRAVNGRIADELVAVGIENPDIVVPHLRSAGRLAEASTRALHAANAAHATLAFEREATYLRWASEGCVPADQPGIIEREAEAWRKGGYLEKAARRYDDLLAVTPAATPALRADVADLWVRAGHSKNGAERFRRLLGDIGVAMFESPERQLLSGLWHRLRFLVRGFPDVEHVPERSRSDHHLDLLFRAGNSLSMTQVSAGFDLMGRFLTAALADPSRQRLVEALGTEAVYEAAIGGAWLEKRAEKLLGLINHLAADSTPILRAARYSYGTLCAWEVGRWREAAHLADEFQKLVRRELHGRAWDLRVVASFAASALFFLGDVGAYRALLDREVAAARDRGDPMGVVHLCLGDAGLVHLLDDEPERAWEVLRETAALVPIGPTIETYNRTILEANTLLYQGRAADAARILAERQPVLDKGGVLGSQIPRAWYTFTYARAVFSARDEDPPRARAILKRSLRVLQSRATPAHRAWAKHVALLARRASGARGGDGATALARAYRDADMELFATAADGRVPSLANPGSVPRWLAPQ
jgi:eukaryotic-like serine/threonine-protein kinase